MCAASIMPFVPCVYLYKCLPSVARFSGETGRRQLIRRVRPVPNFLTVFRLLETSWYRKKNLASGLSFTWAPLSHCLAGQMCSPPRLETEAKDIALSAFSGGFTDVCGGGCSQVLAALSVLKDLASVPSTHSPVIMSRKVP